MPSWPPGNLDDDNNTMYQGFVSICLRKRFSLTEKCSSDTKLKNVARKGPSDLLVAGVMSTTLFSLRAKQKLIFVFCDHKTEKEIKKILFIGCSFFWGVCKISIHLFIPKLYQKTGFYFDKIYPMAIIKNYYSCFYHQ